MIVQYMLLMVILGTALWYVVRKIREPFRSKKECGQACGNCQALDKLGETTNRD